MSGLPLTLRRIAAALAGREPVTRPRGGNRAAVASVLHDPGGRKPRLLLIEPARPEGNP